MKSFKLNTIVTFLSLLAVLQAKCQPGTAKLTPEKKIDLIPQKLELNGKWKLNNEHTVNIPAGYKAAIFYSGKLGKARFMAWNPDSVLHVANLNSGEVLALPDKNHDNVADTVIVAAKDAYGHDLKFYKGAMYVAEEKKVLKFTDTDKDGVYETRTVFIDSVLGGKKRPPGGHTTRTIVFDEAKNKVYLSVGSLCNVCRESDRGVIYEYDLNGKNKKIFARGARNCVGMTLHPATGELWATNNGSDNQGNDIPPEWISVVEKNGFYGYPFAYGYQTYLNLKIDAEHKKILPLTAKDSALVKSMKKPAALVQAHSAPMAIEFSNKSFPEQFRTGAFVAFRGSWNRHPATGYKLIYLHFNGKNVDAVSDIITGFLPDDGKPWARPVGVQTDLRGNIYMTSDDINEFVLILSPTK